MIRGAMADDGGGVGDSDSGSLSDMGPAREFNETSQGDGSEGSSRDGNETRDGTHESVGGILEAINNAVERLEEFGKTLLGGLTRELQNDGQMLEYNLSQWATGAPTTTGSPG